MDEIDEEIVWISEEEFFKPKPEPEKKYFTGTNVDTASKMIMDQYKAKMIEQVHNPSSFIQEYLKKDIYPWQRDHVDAIGIHPAMIGDWGKYAEKPESIKAGEELVKLESEICEAQDEAELEYIRRWWINQK